MSVVVSDSICVEDKLESFCNGLDGSGGEQSKLGALRSMFDDGQFCDGYVAEALALCLALSYARKLGFIKNGGGNIV